MIKGNPIVIAGQLNLFAQINITMDKTNNIKLATVNEKLLRVFGCNLLNMLILSFLRFDCW
jgi:hypothetical protein